MEYYICFQNYTVKGIDCFTCKTVCCGNCYMKMYIQTKDAIKYGLCRFQAHKKPFTGKQFNFMARDRAIRGGFSDNEYWEWAALAEK